MFSFAAGKDRYKDMDSALKSKINSMNKGKGKSPKRGKQNMTKTMNNFPGKNGG